jgi:hypothetical protein
MLLRHRPRRLQPRRRAQLRRRPRRPRSRHRFPRPGRYRRLQCRRPNRRCPVCRRYPRLPGVVRLIPFPRFPDRAGRHLFRFRRPRGRGEPRRLRLLLQPHQSHRLLRPRRLRRLLLVGRLHLLPRSHPYRRPGEPFFPRLRLTRRLQLPRRPERCRSRRSVRSVQSVRLHRPFLVLRLRRRRRHDLRRRKVLLWQFR